MLLAGNGQGRRQEGQDLGGISTQQGPFFLFLSQNTSLVSLDYSQQNSWSGETFQPDCLWGGKYNFLLHDMTCYGLSGNMIGSRQPNPTQIPLQRCRGANAGSTESVVSGGEFGVRLSRKGNSKPLPAPWVNSDLLLH